MLPPRSSRYGTLPLLLCGAVLAVLAPLFWLSTRLPDAPQARTYENLALYERVYPAYHYTFERLGAGEWPLWDPWRLCGTEHLANPRNGVLQPLNLVFFLAPVETALAAHAFLCAFVMGLSFLVFLRALGARHVPALFGAIVYAFAGAGAASLSYPEYAAFLAWLPLAFWGARAVALGMPHASPALGASLALLFLTGALDALLASALVLLPFALFTGFFARRAGGPPLGAVLRGLRTALLIAAALSAAQWLPYLAWAWQQGALWPFGGSELQAALPGSARELVQQLFRVQGDTLLPPLAYFGVVALLVLPAAFFHRQARGEVFFFAGAASLALLLVVYGRAGWDARLPFEAFAFPASLGAAVLAGLGMDRLFETGRDPRSPNVWGPVLIVVVIGALLFYLLPSLGRGVAAIFFVVALAPAVVVRLRWMAAVCSGLAVALAFVELTHALAQRSLHPYGDMPAAMAAHDREFRAAQEQTINGRSIVAARPLDPAVLQNAGPLRGMPFAGAALLPLTPAQRTWWGRLRDAAPGDRADADAAVSPNASLPQLLNYMAVRTVIAAPDAPLMGRKWGEGAPRLRSTLSGGSLQVFVNDDALPRAYWAPQWRAADSLEAAITLLTAPDFRAGKECVVQAQGKALEQLTALAPGSAGAPVDWELVGCSIDADAPERVALKVSAPAPGVTVLADTFAPGWRAELDGAAVPILRVNGLFRGVATPAGDHTITFRYVPVPFYAGLAISLVSVVIGSLWGLLRLFFPAPARRR